MTLTWKGLHSRTSSKLFDIKMKQIIGISKHKGLQSRMSLKLFDIKMKQIVN